jgi:hypothetical protein
MKRKINAAFLKKITAVIVTVFFLGGFGLFITGFTYPGFFYSWGSGSLIGSGFEYESEDQEDLEDEFEEESDEVEIEVSGPVFVEGQNIFYFRVSVEIDDNSGLDVQFSKDNSSGAFGPNVAQVNLAPGEIYSLVITIPALSVSETIVLQGVAGFVVNQTPVNSIVEIEQENEDEEDYDADDDCDENEDEEDYDDEEEDDEDGSECDDHEDDDDEDDDDEDDEEGGHEDSGEYDD